MSSLIEAFPSLVKELSQSLRAAGQVQLADQVEGATIQKITFDEDASAGYIYVQPLRHLNVVESNIISVRHGGTITVATRYWTNLDMDNFDRLTGIEILAPCDIENELNKRANG